MKVPFQDLAAGYESDRPEIDAAVARVLKSGYWVGGPEVEAFEKAFAAFCGAGHAVGVGNGTDAITLALWAAGVNEGDEVILPALSAYPSTTGVMRSGARPVFVDVNEADGLIDPAKVAEAITPETRAIVAVHLYGNACDMLALSALAKKKGIAMVEDCAQAAGVSFNGKHVGSWSRAAAFSFYPTKNLGAVGDAGAVWAPDQETANRLSRLRNYGQTDRYKHDEAGINSRLDPLQAAILSARLPKLQSRNERRIQIGAEYDAALKGHPGLRCIETPAACTPNRHLYPVFAKDEKSRDEWRARLSEKGIETLIHYPVAMHDQKATPKRSRSALCPLARKLSSTELSLPLYPEMTPEQVACVVAGLTE